MVDMEKSKDIEECTRDQASSDRWWKERQMRITASNFGEVCHRRRDNCKKFVERLQSRPDPKKKLPAAIEHGKRCEPVALRKYQQYMRNIGHKVTVHTCGLVVRSDLPYLGCTPDAKITDSIAHPHFGIAEVKSLHTYSNITPREAAVIDKDFYLKLGAFDLLQLDKNHRHYYQVQGQMKVTGAKWCDFIVYSFKGLSIERIAYDDDFCTQMLEKLEMFYFRKFLPHATA